MTYRQLKEQLNSIEDTDTRLDDTVLAYFATQFVFFENTEATEKVEVTEFDVARLTFDANHEQFHTYALAVETDDSM
jgi:hypothetical protein